MTEKKSKKKETKTVFPKRSSSRKKKGESIRLIRLGASLFGVRQDDFIHISEDARIHCIPMTPDHFSGITNVDGITMSVFDLARLMDVSAEDPLKKSLLIVSREKPAAAFAVDEILSEESINEKDCFLLPSCLKSRTIDRAVALNDSVIPVINLKGLYHLILSDKWRKEAPSLELTASAGNSKNNTSRDLTFFKAGDEEFAAAGIEAELPLASLRVTALPFLPDFAAGISLHKGELITLFDACLRMTGKKADEKGILVTRRIGDDLFGFITEKVQKKSKKGDEKTAKLPPVTEKPWMKNILLKGKALIPFVELDMLPGKVTEEISGPQAIDSYHPDKLLSSRFGKEDMNVRDFLLLGRRYSLPAVQVKEVINFSPGRNLPFIPSIITGVQEYEGRIIPIVDIATCFGFRSRPDKGWKMILLENGDFSAFVLAQKVFDEHLLQARHLKRVPVVMKHRFLYGCYADEKTKGVSLILNIFKLCIYFDERSAKEIFKSIDEKAGTALHAEAEAMREPGKASAALTERMEASLGKKAPDGEEITQQEMTGEIPSGTAIDETGTFPEEEAPAREEITQQEMTGEMPSRTTIDETGTFPEEEAPAREEITQQEMTGEIPSGMVIDETGAPPEEEAPAGKEITQQEMTGEMPSGIVIDETGAFPEEEAAAREEITGERPSAEEKWKNEEFTAKKRGHSFHAENPFRDRVEEKIVTKEEINREEAYPGDINERYSEDDTGNLRAYLSQEKDIYAGHPSIYNSANRIGKIILLLIFIAGGLIYLLLGHAENPFSLSVGKGKSSSAIDSRQTIYNGEGRKKREPYFSSAENQTPHSKQGEISAKPSGGEGMQLPEIKEESPIKHESSEPARKEGYETRNIMSLSQEPRSGRVENEHAGDEADTSHLMRQTADLKEAPKKAKKPIIKKGRIYPPLGMFDYYTVREGDTLWDIADAYSKDPFDYYLVAEDNRIIDPDLIYPGQKLRLQKKWKEKKTKTPAGKEKP